MSRVKIPADVGPPCTSDVGTTRLRRLTREQRPSEGGMAMTVVKVSDTSTRAEVQGVIADANYWAKRKPRVIETFTTDKPTAWSHAHDILNSLLDDLEQAPA